MEKLKNLEDLDFEERKKIKKMLTEEKSKGGESKNLDWMYKQDKPDTEEYLLGRRIDQHVMEEEEEEKNAPGATFSENLKRRAEMDMQAKMREDPLYLIHQQEEAARSRLLQNPIRLKQLQKMVAKPEKSKKKKKKEKKKKHKGKSDSDNSDSGDDLLAKYLSIVKGKKKSDKHETEDSHRHQKNKNSRISGNQHKRKGQGHYSEDDLDQEIKRRKSHDSGVKSYGDRHRKHERTDRKHTQGVRGGEEEVKKHKQQERSRKNSEYSGEEETERDKSKHRIKDSRGKHEKRRQEESLPKSYERTEGKSRSRHSRSRSKSPVSHKKVTKYQGNDKPGKSGKLSSEEMARRRVAMMEDAKWRDEQRQKNVERYNEEDRVEEKILEEGRQKGKGTGGFVNPMMVAHASQSNIEDRLKRNIFRIQRTPVALEKSFKK